MWGRSPRSRPAGAWGGAEVTLREGAVESPSGDYVEAAAAPPGRSEGTDEFAGNETIEGLTEELKEKYR